MSTRALPTSSQTQTGDFRLRGGINLRARTIPHAIVGTVAFRWILLVCQTATILITWPLWQVHTAPPMLPALPLPALSLGPLLLGSLLLVTVRARLGLLAHSLLLAYAMLIDQTRLQPEVLSLTILLWGTVYSPSLLTLARVHLIALWIFAGANKLLSPTFLHETAQRLLATIIPYPPGWLDANIGYVIGLSELTLGILALLPATRRVAAFAALGLHCGILLTLSPIGYGWNQAVWPWNVALALAGFAMIAPWRASLLATLRSSPRLVQAFAMFLLISPLGFYFGLTDAYLAHNLYSSNTARYEVSCPGGCQPEQQPGATWNTLHVPLPPEHRLFEATFRQTCHRGDTLVIRDPRWWYRRQGLGEIKVNCPSQNQARLSRELGRDRDMADAD